MIKSQDYPMLFGWGPCNHKVLVRGREGESDVKPKTETGVSAAMSQVMLQALKAGRGKEQNSPLKLLERTSPADTLILVP